MTEQTWRSWYDDQLDQLAASGGRAMQIPAGAPEDLSLDVKLAAGLASLDFSAESLDRETLRKRLASLDEPKHSHFTRRGLPTPSVGAMRMGILIGVVLLLLSFFNSPALAAFGRLIGYGYLPQAGFIRLDETLLILGPLYVESESVGNVSQYIRVSQGISDRTSTRLWVEGNLVQPLAIELRDGRLIKVLGQEDAPGNTWVWTFGPLPNISQQTTLLLSTGQRIPLGWMPANAAGLAPTAVSVPSQTPTHGPLQPCSSMEEFPVQICILAAQEDSQGLHLLIGLNTEVNREALPIDPQSWGISLADGKQNHFKLLSIEQTDDPAALTLLFESIPDNSPSLILRGDCLIATVDNQSVKGLKPFEIPFSLPESKPNLSPTPRVLEVPLEHSVPVPTPTLP